MLENGPLGLQALSYQRVVLARELLRLSDMDIPRKNSKRLKALKRGLILVMGLIVVAVISVGLSRLKPAAPSVDERTLWWGTVERGSMLRQVRGTGTLVSEDILLVPAEVAGRVTRILVLPGAIVEPNTIILELSNPDLNLELLDAQSSLDSAQAQLTAQKAGLQDQLLGMEALRAQMQASYEDAALQAEVDQTQFEDDLISELNLKLSKSRVEQLQLRLDIDRRRYEMFRDQTLPAQLAESDSALNRARMQYQLKERQMGSLHVRAGKRGVLAQVAEQIEPGQSVAPGTILAKITNPERLKAQLKVPESQARDLLIGLPVEVDTYHGVASGEVSRIDPTVVEGNVTIDVSLEGALPKGARPDLSVVGTIEIERLDDVLHVGRPVSASAQGSARLFKLVDDGKHAVRVAVEFGRSSVTTIEVLGGLEADDQIILSDMSQWDAVDRIRLK